MSTEIELLRRQNAALLAELRFWSSEHKHAGDCEFGEEGCYLCRNAEKERFLNITKPLLANADADYVPRAEVDALKRQNAAMRSAIELSYPALVASNADSIAWHIEQGEPFAGLTPAALAAWVRATEERFKRLHAALPPDAGAELLTKEQVKPIAKALSLAVNTAEIYTTHREPPMEGSPKDQWRKAVSYARSLGF